MKVFLLSPKVSAKKKKVGNEKWKQNKKEIAKSQTAKKKKSADKEISEMFLKCFISVKGLFGNDGY